MAVAVNLPNVPGQAGALTEATCAHVAMERSLLEVHGLDMLLEVKSKREPQGAAGPGARVLPNFRVDGLSVLGQATTFPK